MAFDVNCTLKGYEVRAVRSGVSRRTGQPWMQLVLEDSETAEQLTASVPKDMHSDVGALGLRKGDVLNVCVRLNASDDGNNFVQLRAVPELAYDEA